MDPVERIAVRVVVSADEFRRGQRVDVDATPRVLGLVARGYLTSEGPPVGAVPGDVEPEIMVVDPGASVPRIVRPRKGRPAA